MNNNLPELYYSLAPTDLIVYRAERYDGGGFGVSLNDFAPEDVSAIIQMYNAVKKTYDLWLYMRDAPNLDLLRENIINRFGSRDFLSTARSIGSATYALGNTDPLLRKVVHDIRGGALTVLTGYAHLLKAMPSNQLADVDSAVLVARDHAKLMRNAIVDLDLDVREADESVKVHFIDDFVNKWQGSTINMAKKRVEVQVNCTFQGSVTNRCLETSAIDRVLYNYLNNAARFTTNNKVSLTIFPIGDSLVRWVVENNINAEHQDWLHKNTGGDLRKLFSGGITQGGHGIGLSSCTDFVSASFGIDSGDALEQGYLGASVANSTYYAWFHWPAYVLGGHETICDCGD